MQGSLSPADTLSLSWHTIAIDVGGDWCPGSVHTWIGWGNCSETKGRFLFDSVPLDMCEHSNPTLMQKNTNWSRLRSIQSLQCFVCSENTTDPATGTISLDVFMCSKVSHQLFKGSIENTFRAVNSKLVSKLLLVVLVQEPSTENQV